MYHVSAQGVDERMINVHYYYYSIHNDDQHEPSVWVWHHLFCQLVYAVVIYLNRLCVCGCGIVISANLYTQ